MERDISWRRYQRDKKFKKRIKDNIQHHYLFTDSNGYNIMDPFWIDFIGVKYIQKLKSSSSYYYYKYKPKYSSNKNSNNRQIRKYRQSFGLREKDKELTNKIINEYFNR